MSKFSIGHRRSAKLTADAVLVIRQRYADGESQGKLSREYGISVGQIGRIVRGESWQQFAVEPTEQELEHAATASGYVPTTEELTASQSLLERLRGEALDRPTESGLDAVLRRRGGDDPLRRLPIAEDGDKPQETHTDEPTQKTGSGEAEGESEPTGALERRSEDGQ